MFKVHFRLDDVNYQLVAGSLDLSHPYFVSIKDMDLGYGEGLVVNPHLENTKKRFKDVSNIMIPLQNVALIESVPARDKQTGISGRIVKMHAGEEDTSVEED